MLHVEPVHPMDPCVVCICWRGHLPGYCRCTKTITSSRLLYKGAALEARITGIAPAFKLWEQVSVEVNLTA